jgi:predicted amidohydrolase
MLLAAVVQMTSTSDPEANWLRARPLVERAPSDGARLVAKPEISNFPGPPDPRPTGSEQAPVLVRIPPAHPAQPVPGPAAVSERAVTTRSAVGVFIFTIPHSERISLDGSPAAERVRGMVRRIRSEVTEPR